MPAPDPREAIAAEAFAKRFPGSDFSKVGEKFRAKWLATAEQALMKDRGAVSHAPLNTETGVHDLGSR